MIDKKRLQDLVPWTLVLSFIILISIFNYKLYVNNYYTVFDLGLGYRLSYLFSTSFVPVSWPLPQFLVSAKPYTKMFYVFTGLTLLAYDSPLTILVDQAVVIGLGSYAVHKIAHIKTGSFRIAVALQIVYFLYPSTYGFMTQGGNFMVFIEGFLLLNYMFYLQKRPILFLVTGMLGIITNTWAPAIFLMMYFLEWFGSRNWRSLRERLPSYVRLLISRLNRQSLAAAKVHSKRLRSTHMKTLFTRLIKRVRMRLPLSQYAMIGLIAASLIVLSLEIHTYTLHGLISASRVQSAGVSSSQAGTYLSYLIGGSSSTKLTFFYDQLSPFLFVPVASVFIIPVIGYFALLLLFTNYIPYYHPLEQYPFQYAGFLFLATASFLGRLKNRKIAAKLMALMLVSSTFSFLILSPFSLAAIASGQLKNEISNSNLSAEVNHAYSMIPIHSSVFIQNDMPQLMNRDVVYMDGYYDNQTVNYAVMNPIPLNNIAKSFGGFNYFWANHFAMNNSYGVYESVAGVIVFGLHYNGKPVYYVPYSYTQPIGLQFTLGQPLSFGQYAATEVRTLSPGAYNITFHISSASASDVPTTFVFRVIGSNGALLSFQGILKTPVLGQDGYFDVTFPVSLSTFQSPVFALYSGNGHSSEGSFVLNSISIRQTHY